MSTRVVLAVMALGLAGVGCRDAPTAAPAGELPLERLTLPPGFSIEVWAGDLPDARSLARGPAGTIFVGSRRAGVVRALPDRDGDGRPDRVVTLASGLEMPNGVAVRDGALHVAEVHRVLRFDDIEERLDDPPAPVVVTDRYPRDGHHGWKFIAFGPDGNLHVPVGAPCNVCDEGDPYAAITRIGADGTGFAIVARGVRNTVGFDWHPQTGELWFTDNGRDWLGDDAPPDELNRLRAEGLHFGYPHCHGGTVVDPEFGDERGCDGFEPPALNLGAHVAALGVRFYRGTAFPPEFRGDAFIAEHGSWNRSEKVGYRLSRVRLDGSRVLGLEPFVEGWLQGQEAWGRPVDLLELPDGSLLVSDDHAGAIYRIRYESARADGGRASSERG